MHTTIASKLVIFIVMVIVGLIVIAITCIYLTKRIAMAEVDKEVKTKVNNYFNVPGECAKEM